jgi:alpha,alpha-trehalose phosphorylase
MDLHDLENNTRDGVHIASLAGAWIAAVAGFGGMRDHDGRLSFAPRLPARIERLSFGIHFRGRRLTVAISRTEAVYTLLEGESLDLSHHGNPIQLLPDQPAAQTIPSIAARPAPTQPQGRAPIHRGGADASLR